jgi:hypothetical protein
MSMVYGDLWNKGFYRRNNFVPFRDLYFALSLVTMSYAWCGLKWGGGPFSVMFRQFLIA